MELTIRDIAKMANVSRTTVSRVLNNRPDVKPETRKLILELIEKHKYQPNAFAQAITSKKSSCIGLVIPYTVDYVLQNAFYAEVIRGISSELNKKGYYLLFCYAPKEEYVANMFKQKRTDGFILLSPGKLHKKLVAILNEVKAPFVSTSKVFDEEGVIYADVDNYLGASIAVEHLISLGHRKIAFILNSSGVLASSQDRLHGYQDTLTKYGITIEKNFVEIGDTTINSGYTCMQRLLSHTEVPTAVFVAADMMAIGAIKAIKESGRKVPEDISVIGFDNIPLSEFLDPPLTTIKQPAFEKGEKAANILVKMLDNKKQIKSLLLDVELIKRKSTSELRV